MTASPWKIRRATAADVPSVVACLAAAFEPYRPEYTTGAFNDTVLNSDSCRARLREMTILIAEHDGKVVGTIACEKVSTEEGHVRGMAVFPSHQGTGVAEALLTAAEIELRVRGCPRITLDTTQYLLPAIRFYERNGYLATGRVSDFFGMALIEYAKDV